METDRTAGWRERLPGLAYAFGTLSLVALTITPAVMVQRMTAAVEANATTFEPARRLVRELIYLFEHQVAELRALVLSGDPRFLEGYREARAEERQTLERLAPLARRIGPEAVERLETVQRLSSRWHVADDSLAGGRVTLERYESASLPRQFALNDSTLAATALLAGEIDRASAEYFEEVGAEVRRQRAVAVWLGLVALLAALVVGWFARRQRALTRELARAVEEETRLREESEQRRRDLEQVTESRARLMRGFSHDVKNPLGAADGFLQLLEEGILDPLTEKQKEGVGKARRSIASALNLIEDLLGLARAETGRIEIERVPTDLREVVGEAAEVYRAQAEARGLAFTVELAADVARIRSDPARVRQVLGNLISNAVKYTSEGGVAVRLAEREGGAAPGPGRWIAVAVSDTGPGISQEKQRLLFQEFVRLEPGAGRGAGIGLSISRRIARALGGEVTVESEVGRGSTFTLWLPGEAAEAGSRAAAD